MHEPVEAAPFDPVVFPERYRDDYGTSNYGLPRRQHLIQWENATLAGSEGVPILPDGKLCLEGNWLPRLLYSLDVSRRRPRFSPHRLRGEYFSLLGLWHREFYHWFHDILPRLECALPHLPPDVRFILTEDARPFQIESLQSFGIDTGKIEFIPRDAVTTVERLWFATALGNTDHTSDGILRAVAARLRGNFGCRCGESFQRYYVSRRKAACRRIVNETELVEALTDHGFQLVCCEDLPFSDQVRVFSQADFLIGPHGGGMTQMLFMPESSRVVEVFEPSVVRFCYWSMARSLRHRYGMMIGETQENEEMEPDMRASVSEIVGRLRSRDGVFVG